MIIPIRCFSCGAVVASKYDKYNKLLKDGKSKKEALDELKVNRFCCRSVIMTNVDAIDIIGAYK